MKSIFDSAVAFFDAQQWPVQPSTPGQALQMQFSGSHGQWTCKAETDEGDRSLVFYSLLPVTAPRHAFPAVAELINRINYCQPCGNFELGYLDGDIRFRTSIEAPAQDMSDTLLDRVVYNNVATADLYLPIFVAVIEQGMTPLDAIATL